MAPKPPQVCPHCKKRTDALVGIDGRWSCMHCLTAALDRAVAGARRIQKLAKRGAQGGGQDG